ncbi:hypothetical protein KXD40_004182 [Peronospora effusa]|nr:hypothetical protein KXD40_004182 [Peronospora effusa]
MTHKLSPVYAPCQMELSTNCLRYISGTATKFEVGDFVLCSRVDPLLPGLKLMVPWVGSLVITGIKENCFEI